MIEVPVTQLDVRTTLWRVNADVTVEWRGQTLTLEEGFTTNLASVPRLLWVVTAPYELSVCAAALHDRGYGAGGVYAGGVVLTRAEVDQMFLDLMTENDVLWWRRETAYRAVRLFGGSPKHWNHVANGTTGPLVPRAQLRGTTV